MSNRNKNMEGYYDKTACSAIEKISHEHAEVNKVIKTIREVAGLAGYDILGRIVLENRENGTIYR